MQKTFKDTNVHLCFRAIQNPNVFLAIEKKRHLSARVALHTNCESAHKSAQKEKKGGAAVGFQLDGNEVILSFSLQSALKQFCLCSSASKDTIVCPVHYG